MAPFRHYPNDKNPEGSDEEVHRMADMQEPTYPRKEPPRRVETETGEHIMEERHKYRRAEDARKTDLVERVQNTPLTLKNLLWLGAAVIAANQSINAWREKNVTREQFNTLSDKVSKLAENVNTLATQFAEARRDDNFKNYSICVTMKVQNPSKYPRFCDREEIQSFDPTH